MKDFLQLAGGLALAIFLANAIAAEEEAPAPLPDLPKLESLDAYHVLTPKLTPEEFAKIRARAEAGDAAAADLTMLAYLWGYGVAEDFRHGRAWLTKAYAAGAPIATLYEGRRLMGFYLSPTPKDPALGARLLERTRAWLAPHAAKEDAFAMYLLGACEDALDRPEESFRMVKAAAEGGFAKAQLSLGLHLYYGQGRARDQVEAEKWIRTSADAGDAAAMNYLAMFERDVAAPDERTGKYIACLECAIKAKSLYALRNLGHAYMTKSTMGNNGVCTRESQEKALPLFKEGAERGDGQAAISAYFTICDLLNDNERGGEDLKYLKLACELDNAHAMFEFAERLAGGEGMPADPERAQHWYLQAALQGAPEALAKVRPELFRDFFRPYTPAPAPPPPEAPEKEQREQIAGWIAALDAEAFTERQEAFDLLAKAGNAAHAQLQEAATTAASLEARNSIARLIAALPIEIWTAVLYWTKDVELLPFERMTKDNAELEFLELVVTRNEKGEFSGKLKDRIGAVTGRLDAATGHFQAKVDPGKDNSAVPYNWSGCWIPSRCRIEGLDELQYRGVLVYPRKLTEKEIEKLKK